MGVDGKVLALNVVFDELLYAKMTFGESWKSNLQMKQKCVKFFLAKVSRK